MALLDRLRGSVPESAPTADPPQEPERSEPLPTIGEERSPDVAYQELKSRVHNALFALLDLSKMSQVSPEQVTEDVVEATRRVLEEDQVLLSADDRERLVKEIQDEVFGLGPLEPLLQDPEVNDILVNGPGDVRVERSGRLDRTLVRFKDDAHLMRIVDKIVSAVGRRVDESNPIVDARLADGSRVNVIVPPLALDGPAMSIRRFSKDPLQATDLVANGTASEELIELLQGVVQARLNVLISGGTGAGKTTFLNMLSGFIPDNERIVTIEDAAELQLNQEHVVRLETRPANLEGAGRVTQRDLVVNSLRMRPDRIVVGEVRGSEALVHANSPRDALMRIETMVAMTGLDIPQRSVRQQLASAVNVIIQIARHSDGRRRIISVQEITGMEGEVLTTQEIFGFQRRGIDEDGTVLGELRANGIRPNFAATLDAMGITLRGDLFTG
jgi:pilus assembly protein CpaF